MRGSYRFRQLHSSSFSLRSLETRQPSNIKHQTGNPTCPNPIPSKKTLTQKRRSMNKLSNASDSEIVKLNKDITTQMRNGRCEAALRVFNVMPRRSPVSYNAMISGYLANGKFDLAKDMFEKMPERDLVSWNVMLSGYVRERTRVKQSGRRRSFASQRKPSSYTPRLSFSLSLRTQFQLRLHLCSKVLFSYVLMEQMEAPILDAIYGGAVNFTDNGAEAESFKHRVDEIFVKVDKLEQRVNEIEQSSKKQPNACKSSSTVKDKDKHIPSMKKQQQDAACREAAAAKRMQELMRHFGTILRQITQHKWAWPFLQPVDVEGLGLHDYYKVIDKPMDFSTIKNQMEAKDGTGYKNVREICADVRLVFKNAMKYNDERSDVHVMAKTLLAKFEEKWLQLLPKVTEEEKRLEEEEAEAQLKMQLAEEAARAKMARDLSNELYEVDMHLEELREMVVQKCRKMSTEEKRKLGVALTRLSPEDLSKALDIVAQNNPGFQATADEVDLDIDAQTESTLWRLKFFVKDAIEAQGKSSASMGGNTNTNTNNHNSGNKTNNNLTNATNKRKREISDAIVKTAKKKNKKPSP